MIPYKSLLGELVFHLKELEALVAALRSGSDHTSTLLLAMLRLGIATDELVGLECSGPWKSSHRLHDITASQVSLELREHVL